MVIVRSTIDLAHNLKLKVVAEGVESQQHIDVLSDLGCDLGQGFFIARPMRIDLLDDWLGQTSWQIGSQVDGIPAAAMTA
jgi:EAL domain-containing protein (putative c-di-GMP-specific phosphodiesterase class I)